MTSHCCQSYLACTGIDKTKTLFPYRPRTQGNNGYIFRDVIGCVEYLRFENAILLSFKKDLALASALRSAFGARRVTARAGAYFACQGLSRSRAAILGRSLAEACSAAGHDNILIINDIRRTCSIIPHCVPHFRGEQRAASDATEGQPGPGFDATELEGGTPIFRSARAHLVRTRRSGQKDEKKGHESHRATLPEGFR